MIDLSTIPGFVGAEIEEKGEKERRGVGETAAEAAPDSSQKIDRKALIAEYEVGDRFIVTGEPYYEAMRLRITAVDRVGLTTNDLDEVKSALSVPVAHCIGWPTVLAWRKRGMCESRMRNC